MREYLNKKLVVETLKTHPGQAFSSRELESVTMIPIKTLRSTLKHLVHENQIMKKTVEHQPLNKKGNCRINQQHVWYYI